MDDTHTLEGLIYVVWVSIPLTLVFLAAFVKIRDLAFGGEADPKRPRRLFRTANLFALYAAACMAIDYFFLSDLRRWFPTRYFPDDQVLMVRVALLPIIAIAGTFLIMVFRMVFPRRGFDKLQMEVRGSSPMLLFFAFAVVVFLVWSRSESVRNRTPSPTVRNAALPAPAESNPEESAYYQAPDKRATRAPQDTSRGLLSSLSENTSRMVGELTDMVGISAPEQPRAPDTEAPENTGDRPDYSSEGNVTFGPVAAQIATEEQVSPTLVQAVIEISSGFNLRWEGKYGHRGLMGLRPELIAAQGGRDVLNAYQNIRIGTRELKKALDAQSGDTRRALAVYRSGANGLTLTGKISDTESTDDFVRRVMAIVKISGAREEAGTTTH